MQALDRIAGFGTDLVLSRQRPEQPAIGDRVEHGQPLRDPGLGAAEHLAGQVQARENS